MGFSREQVRENSLPDNIATVEACGLRNLHFACRDAWEKVFKKKINHNFSPQFGIILYSPKSWLNMRIFRFQGFASFVRPEKCYPKI